MLDAVACPVLWAKVAVQRDVPGLESFPYLDVAELYECRRNRLVVRELAYRSKHTKEGGEVGFVQDRPYRRERQFVKGRNSDPSDNRTGADAKTMFPERAWRNAE